MRCLLIDGPNCKSGDHASGIEGNLQLHLPGKDVKLREALVNLKSAIRFYGLLDNVRFRPELVLHLDAKVPQLVCPDQPLLHHR
jgi:hypothetical protein